MKLLQSICFVLLFVAGVSPKVCLASEEKEKVEAENNDGFHTPPPTHAINRDCFRSIQRPPQKPQRNRARRIFRPQPVPFAVQMAEYDKKKEDEKRLQEEAKQREEERRHIADEKRKMKTLRNMR